MVREIVTVQIGHYANQVGAHLWNQLEREQSIDLNTFYVINSQTKQSSAARVIILDRRNTFGWLLNSPSSDKKQILNDQSLEIVHRANDEGNGKDHWPDILKTKVRFHPRSLLPLRDHWQSSDANDFDLYPIGQQTFRNMFDQIEDSVHFQLEQCDHLQGFRCLYDSNDGFSGLFSAMQDYLIDECPKRPIWSFALSEKTPSILNSSFALIHSLNINEMPTIPCRQTSDSLSLSLAIQHALISSTTLDTLADRLCSMKHYLLSLSLQLPFDLHGKTLFSYLQDRDLLAAKDPLACHCFLRGLQGTQLYNRAITSMHFDSAADLLEAYFREQYDSRICSSAYSWPERLVTPEFDDVTLLTLLINDRDRSKSIFDRLINEMKPLKYKLISKRWEENGFDEQTFEQLNIDLENLHERYEPNLNLF